jgi:hypothetical protein
MSASTATGQHSWPDILVVTLTHRSLRIDPWRLSALAAVGPGDWPGLMIPWLVTHASQDQRMALFRSIPPLRPFYWLTLRYYPPVRPGVRPRRLGAWGRARPASVYEAVIGKFTVELGRRHD